MIFCLKVNKVYTFFYHKRCLYLLYIYIYIDTAYGVCKLHMFLSINSFRLIFLFIFLFLVLQRNFFLIFDIMGLKTHFLS